MKTLEKRFQILCCKDGFLSILDRDNRKLKRRLGAALPVHSVDSIELALDLVQAVSHLACCDHGGRTGTLIEPKVHNWPRFGGELSDLDALADFLQEKERQLFPVRVAR